MKTARIILALALLGCGDDSGGGGNIDARVGFPDARPGDGAPMVDSPPMGDGGGGDGASAMGTCATPTALAIPGTASGTTVGAVDQQTGCPGPFPSMSNDVVFQVMPTMTGTMNVTLSGLTTDMQIFARTTCADAGSEIACADVGLGGEDELLSVDVTAGTPVFLIVDAYAADQAGPFTITTAFIDPGTACTAATAAVLGDNAGDTTTGTNVLAGTCTGSGAKEKVFTYTTPGTAADTGDLGLTLASAADLGVYVRTVCTSGASQIACVDAVVGGTNETATVPLDGASSVSIVVDGFTATDEGPFTLTVAWTAAVCGDGTVNGNECEPPSTASCDAMCRPIPEMGPLCNNFTDDDGDGTTDCLDPTMCAGTAICTPGAGAVGTACDAPSDCAASAMDPACIDETEFGWPGGACGEQCSGADACPTGSECFLFGADGTTCVETCPTMMDTECANPAAYDCIDVGQGSPLFICLPRCTADAHCPTVGNCDLEQGLCRTPEAGTCGDTVDTDRDGDLNCGDVECIGDAACPALTETEPNDSSGTADAYAAGFIGAVGMPMDTDYVSITVAAGSTLTAEVTDLTGPAGATTGGCLRRALDSMVRIYDTNGTTVLVENDDIDLSTNWCSRAMTTAPLPAGTYFVQVLSQTMFAPMDTFVYGLSLTVTP